jgi:uncharacterized membrane protein YkvA (DUF1232 family)
MADASHRRHSSKTEASAGMWENLILSWRLYRDPRVSVWLKRLPVMLAVVYLVMPFDLIPDVLLGPGQMDDLGMMGLMALSLTWLPRFAPAEVVAEHKSKMRGAGEKDPSAESRSEGSTRHGNEEVVIEPPFRVHR